MAGTEQGTKQTDEQQQQVHRDTGAAHTQSGAGMNANSACAQNQYFLMLEVEKHKPKTANYTFEPACGTDACWIPERHFECNDHRGHHCWLEPLVNMIETTLQSYDVSKQQDPSNTSMCILVLVMSKASWWKKIRGMKRLRLYPKGAELSPSNLNTRQGFRCHTEQLSSMIHPAHQLHWV